MRTHLKYGRIQSKGLRHARVPTRYKKLNQSLSKQINIEKFLSENRDVIMETDKDGHLMADPSKPLHRRWMED